MGLKTWTSPWSKDFFKYGRRHGRGSPRLSWPIFPEDSRHILGSWGLRPQFLRRLLEYSGNIGQLSLGDPLPYLLPCLEISYDRRDYKGAIRGYEGYQGAPLTVFWKGFQDLEALKALFGKRSPLIAPL